MLLQLQMYGQIRIMAATGKLKTVVCCSVLVGGGDRLVGELARGRMKKFVYKQCDNLDYSAVVLVYLSHFPSNVVVAYLGFPFFSYFCLFGLLSFSIYNIYFSLYIYLFLEFLNIYLSLFNNTTNK